MCLERGGYAIFLTLMGGGIMQFYHLGMGGGQCFFSYSEALSATPPPSAEIYEQSLRSCLLVYIYMIVIQDVVDVQHYLYCAFCFVGNLHKYFLCVSYCCLLDICFAFIPVCCRCTVLTCMSLVGVTQLRKDTVNLMHCIKRLCILF